MGRGAAALPGRAPPRAPRSRRMAVTGAAAPCLLQRQAPWRPAGGQTAVTVFPIARDTRPGTHLKGATNRNAKTLIRTVAALALVLGVLAAGSPAWPHAVAAPASKEAQAAAHARPRRIRAGHLVLRVYFRDSAERDRLATELGAEEVATTGGYLTVWADRALLPASRPRASSRDRPERDPALLNDPHLFGDTFYGGYKTVEEMQTFLDQKVAAYPTLAEKVDIGNSWCKAHPGSCTLPSAYNGYDLLGAAHHQPGHRRPQAGLLVRRGHPLPRDRHARSGHALY